MQNPSVADRAGNRDFLIPNLKDFYKEHGIAVGSFNCVYRQKCVAAAGNVVLTEGAEAHVGEYYGTPFKVVVVSADRGDGQSETVEERTATIQSLEEKSLNPHMTGTLDLLRAVLGQPGSGTSLFKHFAMTNAVKCTTSSRRRMPDAMFLSCAQFTIGEVAALRPDLVVVQGAGPRLALQRHLAPIPAVTLERLIRPYRNCPNEVIGFIRNTIDDHFRTFHANGCRAIALLTPHPSDRRGRWKTFAKHHLGIVGALSRRLLLSAEINAEVKATE